MEQLQTSPLSLQRSHPSATRTLLALKRGLSHHVLQQSPLLHIKAMGSRHSMWLPDEYDEPSSGLGGYSAATPASVSIAQLPVSQQSLSLAFHMLDKDRDGLISAAEAYKMVAFYLALQDHKLPAAVAAERPLSWDQHLVASINSARKLAGRQWAAMADALESFVAAKMAGGLQKSPPRCSDIVWAGLGMGVTMLLLGMLVSAVKTWPVVGPWHQQGLPLLLGSFGTFAILLFGKPEAEAVRLWPIIGGQLGATAIAVTVVQLWGPGLLSRAAAMAATVTYMMWTDTIHPPGGALVLMAMGDNTIQQFGWLYMLWPSLLLCLAVMLPISAVTNWLRRTRQFDWPGQAAAAAASLHKKRQDWDRQQLMKTELLQRSASVVLSDRFFLPREVPLSNRFIQALQKMLDLQNLQHTLKQQLLELQQLQDLERQQQQQQEKHKQQDVSTEQDAHDLRTLMVTPQPRSPESSSGGAPPPDNHPTEQPPLQQQRPVSPSADFTSSRTPSTPSTAAKLDDAVRRRLRREADRKLEDEEHREAIWGAALPGLKKFEQKLQKLHEQRLKQRRHQEQQRLVQRKQQLSAGGVGGSGSQQVLSATGGSMDPSRCCDKQPCAPSPQAGLFSSGRPAWMYRWRSDISTKPGVGDWEGFAPDDT